MPISRRTLLRAFGTLGLAGALGGCSQAGTPAAAPTPSASGLPTFDPVGRVAPDAQEVLSLISGSFEQLVGANPFAFGLVGPDNQPVTGADPQLWVVPTDGEPTGPYATRFYEVPGQPLGIYVADVDLQAAGTTSFVAVTPDGRAGSGAVQVADASGSQLPAPGQDATSVATPTTANPGGMTALCTADPPCGMHDVSLDEALAAGRPVMLVFATPQYCHTAVCGPSVKVIDGVRTAGDWGNTAFVHVEIFSDEGETVAEPVSEWGLPTEPWLFAIGTDGTIAERFDGPLLTVADEVAAIAQRVAQGA